MVVDGSVRKSSGRVGISVQLIDAVGRTICGPTASTARSTTFSICRTGWRLLLPELSSQLCRQPKSHAWPGVRPLILAPTISFFALMR